MDQIWYRCGNRNSQFYNLDIRADYVDNAIIKLLKKLRVTEKEFEDFLEFSRVGLRELEMQTQEKVNIKTLEINHLKSEKKKYMEKNMGVKKDNEEEKIYQDTKADYDHKVDFLRSEIVDMDKNERNEEIEIEAFINIFGKADQYYKNASFVQKRKITKILFSNIILDHEKRLHIKIKP
jgi:hypothetical protein